MQTARGGDYSSAPVEMLDVEPDRAARIMMASRDKSRRCLEESEMPATSKQQQKAAGAALAAKRGERSKASLKGASRQMVESMSEQELRRMASVKRKGLPRRSAGS